jgi:hypothetical protein
MLSTFIVLPFKNFSYQRYASLVVEKMPVNGLEEPAEDESLIYVFVYHKPDQCAEGSVNEH